MFGIKYRYENIEFYDCRKIESHLEKMAAKGWMIEKISGKFYKYKKVQPQQLKFAVTYAPKVSAYDLLPTMTQANYLEMCEEYGWQVAILHNQLQVLYNPDVNTVEIETDGANMLDNIHTTAKKTFIPRTAINLFLSVNLVVMMILLFIASPLEFICTPFYFPGLLLGCVGAVNNTVELIRYFKWYKNAVIYRSTADSLLPADKNGVINNTLKTLFVVTALWVSATVLSGIYRKVFIGIITVILLTTAVSEFLIRDSKEMGKSAGDVKFTSWFFGMLVFFIGYYGVMTMDSNIVEKVDGAYVSYPKMNWADPAMNRFTDEEKAYIVKMYGDLDVAEFRHLIWFPAEYEDVENRYSYIFPLELADYNPYVKERGEFFYRDNNYAVVDYTDAKQKAGGYTLQYSIYYPQPHFYQLVLYAVKRTEVPNAFYINKHPEAGFRFEETDETPWNADRAYQLFDYKGYKTGVFVICDKDRIIKLQLDNPDILTDKDIVKIADKLIVS